MVRRVKKRFPIKRVILVCDQEMVSKKNIAFLEKENFGYILEVRLWKVTRVRKDVLDHSARYRVVKENLRDKKIELGEERYIACLNPDEEERERTKRKNCYGFEEKA